MSKHRGRWADKEREKHREKMYKQREWVDR